MATLDISQPLSEFMAEKVRNAKAKIVMAISSASVKRDVAPSFALHVNIRELPFANYYHLVERFFLHARQWLCESVAHEALVCRPLIGFGLQ
jgi:hypothetical protein